MLLELMSNGTLAELPPDSALRGWNAPVEIGGINLSDEPSVTLLLPHNKYLIGTTHDRWIYVSALRGSDGHSHVQSVSLYDDEALSLMNDGTCPPIVLPGKTVTALRSSLLMLTEPPGSYHATVSMLRTFMRYHPVFNPSDPALPDEQSFIQAMSHDSILRRTYWTLRFALARGEMETVGRLKAWLRAGPDNFNRDDFDSRIWFSLTDLPDAPDLNELESLSFSQMELSRMTSQNISPLLLYSPKSGWLILGRFGRVRHTIFFVWVYLNHEMYSELRERRHLSINEIINAVWCERETEEAMTERAKYKGAVTR